VPGTTSKPEVQRGVLEVTAFEHPRDFGEHFKGRYGPTIARFEMEYLLAVGTRAREDLTPVEEARACVTLAQEFGLTYLQIAGRVGRSKSVVSNLVRLLNLSEDLLELLDRGLLSKSQGLTTCSASR